MTEHVRHLNLAPGFRGGERQTELLIRGLARRGYRQALVARKAGELARRVADVPELRLIEVAPDLWSAARGLRGAALVHAHEARAAHAAALGHALGGPPYLLTRREQRAPKRDAWTRRVYRRARRVVAISSAVERALAGYDSRLRLTRIPSAHAGLPVDATLASRLDDELPGGFRVGQIGALQEAHKGQGDTIEALRRLAVEAPDLHCFLLGEGPDEATLRRRAAGLAQVHFLGRVEAVGAYLACLDLVVMPSRHEALGSSLLDAMAHGLPVVASRVGGVPDIVDDGVNGLLVPPGDVDALAGGLWSLYRDSARRRRMGEAARRTAAGFAPERMCARYAALYAELGATPGQ